VLTDVTVNIIIFTDMTPRSLVDTYQGSVLTGYPDGGGSSFHRNTDSYEMIKLLIPGDRQLYNHHSENCKSCVFCELFRLTCS
jgi:hypothetical protein